ncbi:YeaH/YhbH family protein [Serratia ureilytica]
MHELEDALTQLENTEPVQLLEEERLRKEIAELRKKIESVPFIDTFDLRYKNYERRPEPSSQAVMFCLMDVSGSMDQATKDMAKRFYILLYLFLSRTYKNVEVVYIRHHTRRKRWTNRSSSIRRKPAAPSSPAR